MLAPSEPSEAKVCSAVTLPVVVILKIWPAIHQCKKFLYAPRGANRRSIV
jgi:hypothetical protein